MATEYTSLTEMQEAFDAIMDRVAEHGWNPELADEANRITEVAISRLFELAKNTGKNG